MIFSYSVIKNLLIQLIRIHLAKPLKNNLHFVLLWLRCLSLGLSKLPRPRGVHGSGWVGLRGLFDPTHHSGSKKIQPNPSHKSNPTQLNPTQLNPHGSGWIHGFDKLLLLLLLNWVEKNININILKKPKD